MSTISDRYLAHQAKIRAIGSLLRVEKLDQDLEGPNADAKADALLKEYTVEDVKEGLDFAAYLGSMADPSCSACSGLGAVKTDTAYDPCDCARKNEKAKRASQPAFVSKNAAREADLDLRIAETEKQLTDAKKRQAEALAPIAEEIKQAEAGLVDYRDKKSDLDQCLEHSKITVNSTRKFIADLHAQVRAAEADLRTAESAVEKFASALVEHENASAQPINILNELYEKSRRVAGHHEPKIDKAERKLSRLRYLRGDAPKVSAEDVTAFVPDLASQVA